MAPLARKPEDALLRDAFLEVMRSSEDYIFVKDTQLVYLGGSETFAHMAGLESAAQLPGKTDYDLFPRDIAEKYRADDRQVLTTDQPIEGIVERLPDRGGRPCQARTTKRAVRDADGRITGVYGISRDISQELDLEQQVRAAQEASDLIRRLPGGVGILHEQDGAFRLDFANAGWARAHHLSEERAQALVGGSVMACIYADDRQLLLDEYRRVNALPDAEGCVTYRSCGEDGAAHWLQVQFRFAYEKEGVRYYYASYTDMDEQMRAEERLADSQNALREAVAHSDIQFFTYFPGQHRCEIYAVNERLTELPLHWEHFPDDFLAYAAVSEADAQTCRAMLRKIDEGADSAECVVQFACRGICTWERMRLRAVRDAAGHTVKAQGYSANVTDRLAAEERLHRERVRLKSLEDNTFEAFSFNVSKNSSPEIQTHDEAMLQVPIREEVVREALRISPPIGRADAKTREILLRAANRIPDAAERQQFLETCSGKGLQQALREGRFSGEVRYRRTVGTAVRWVSSRAEVLPDPESGDLIAFYYTTDINDEVITAKIAEKVMQRNYETVSFCDLQTGRLYVKAAHAGAEAPLQGLPYTEAMDSVCAQSVAPAQQALYREQMALPAVLAVLKKNPVCTFYYERKAQGAQPAAQMKSDAFYLDEHRDVLVFLLTDVTDIFEQERDNREKMADALTAAKQASAAKSNFLSRMSHEIRTPLNAIIGMDTIAAQSLGNPEKEADCISKIGISARYLLTLINDILDMSRIESGKMLLKNEKFLFRDFITSINTMIYNQTKTKGLDYECTVSSEVAEAYVGDAMKLQQVLINILGNAVKFTEKGKVSLDIHPASCKGTLSVLRFTVNDTGIGIREDFIDRIFDPFEQSDTSTTTTFGGTGLGLAITKNLVGLMGGSIKVRSIVGVGSEFMVDVPLTVDESILVQPKLDLHFEKMHTLIVDDDLVVCEQTNNILSDIGMEGEWVTTGREAVERVRSRRSSAFYYDYILVDWKMPDMDGIETTREIRRIVGPDVTIIIITAYDWESIEAEAKAAGANMLISKPLLKSTLVSAFQKAKGQGEAEPLPEAAFDFTGRRVLVAEDNQINAEIARSLLENKHFAVELATNGLKAMELYIQKPVGYYDAILMDIRMPLMDGLQAATNIRHWNREDAKLIPIIAMTANAFDEDVEKSKAVGMNAHLSKPIDPDLMYSTLYRVIMGE